MYRYHATIVKWIDGDTVEVDVDLGFQITIMLRVRVYGIDAPEIHSTDKTTKAAGISARDFAMTLAPVGSVLEILSHKATDPIEKYGRWLATIWLANGKDFATEMIAAGCAVAYFGGPRDVSLSRL